jgi:ABC-2 type transport system permease protein
MAEMRAQRHGPGDAYIFVSFLVYGVLAPGLLGVSSLLASDRVQRIVEYKRALPAPFGSVVIAKLLMAVSLSITVIVLIVVIAATLGRVPLTVGQFAATAGIALAGVLPISAIGLYLATRASPSGVSPIAGALLVGMAILAGLFYPLPGALSTLRPIWPTYHLQQVSLAAMGSPTGGSVVINVLALVGFTLVFGLLAAKRLARPE